MYLPRHFEESRIPVLHGLIRDHPLGTLVTLTNQGLEANHLPFEIDRERAPFGVLRGHIARGNPLWREATAGAEALVVFQGPSAYVSPSWYPTKKETGKVVPTWNYAVVHAHGVPRFVEDRAWLRGLVERLTNRHEAGRADPWKVSDAPDDYIEAMLGAIVGIEIPLARLVGKWKVSQNRPAADRAGVVEGLLAERGNSAEELAELVRQRR